MSFPRLAIHTGNKVVTTNRHPEWEGTIVVQHNETTATMLKHGPNMTSAAKNRHPVLSTWQSDCRGRHWSDYAADARYAIENDVHDQLLFGQEVVNGQVVVPGCCGGGCGCEVTEAVAH